MAVLATLVLLELYLCTGFLPMHWQYAINDAINGVLQHLRPHAYDYSVVTHPAIDQEIDQVLRENTWMRMGLYVAFVAVLAVNTIAIVRLWRVLRRTSVPQAG